MTIFYRAQEKIEGKKILYWFGSVSQPHQKKGTRQYRVTLGLHGGARVEKPVERSKTGEAREMDEISCTSAVGLAERITTSSQKERVGTHRCFVGDLKGDAECTITVPMENIPDAHGG